jgi:hypothetical protein
VASQIREQRSQNSSVCSRAFANDVRSLPIFIDERQYIDERRCVKSIHRAEQLGSRAGVRDLEKLSAACDAANDGDVSALSDLITPETRGSSGGAGLDDYRSCKRAMRVARAAA